MGQSEYSFKSLPVLSPLQRPILLLGGPLHTSFSLDSGNFTDGCGFLLLPVLGLLYIILYGFSISCPHLCKQSFIKFSLNIHFEHAICYLL